MAAQAEANPMKVDAFPTCRFYVTMDGVAQAVFTEVSGLQMETEVMEYQEGGNNGYVHRLPGRVKASNLTLKRGMTASHGFYQWIADIASGKITRGNVSVVMFDYAGNKLARWNLINAYPVKWTGPQLNAREAAAAIETLELAHDGVTLE
jgi:phage tail-like protein